MHAVATFTSEAHHKPAVKQNHKPPTKQDNTDKKKWTFNHLLATAIKNVNRENLEVEKKQTKKTICKHKRKKILQQESVSPVAV